MNRKSEPRDPIDELRRANPFPADQLPASSRARLWARIQEERMADQTPVTDAGQTRLPRWALAASGAAIAVVAVAALTISGVMSPQAGNGAAGGGNGAAGGGMAMCLAFSVEELQARDFAFDGTVTAINGNRATFTVNTAFWGVEAGSSVTLEADLMIGDPNVVALEGGPQLIVGDRYLISGDDTFAWSCGYSLVWDETTAAEWAALAP